MDPILFEIGLVIDTILGCGSRNQSMLAVSHRDAITINMLGGELDSNNSDLDGFDLVQFGFITSEDFCSDGNNSSFDLVVPCLPRGALLEIVPHRYSIKNPFLKRIVLLEKRTWPKEKFSLVILRYHSVGSKFTGNRTLSYQKRGNSQKNHHKVRFC